MDCPEDTVYHHPQQVCLRESEGKLDDKPIAVLRYLEGLRLKKLKHQLQMELADPDDDADTPMLNTVNDAEVVTTELVDDIEAALDDLDQEEDAVEGEDVDDDQDGDDGNDAIEGDDGGEELLDDDPENEL